MMVADAWQATARARGGTAAARERYLAGGEFEAAPPVREAVRASWDRCRGHRLDPGRTDLPYRPDAESSEQLRRAAAPVLDRLQQTLAWTRIGVLLTDATARVVERRVGEAGLHRHLDAVQLAPGFSYAEQDAGTNGIGTALAEGCLFTVRSSEHFAERLQPFACAGAPVRDPLTGSVQGVLDLTCWQADAHPLMVRLVRRSAREIEQLLLEQYGARERQLVRALRRRPSAGSEAQSGAAGLDGAERAALVDRAAVLLAAGGRGEARVRLGRGRTARLTCRPVGREQQAQGGGGPAAGRTVAGFAVEAVLASRRNDLDPPGAEQRPSGAGGGTPWPVPPPLPPAPEAAPPAAGPLPGRLPREPQQAQEQQAHRAGPEAPAADGAPRDRAGGGRTADARGSAPREGEAALGGAAEMLVLAGEPRVSRLAVQARRRLALLGEAGAAIGRSPDVVRTAEELAAFTVPRFAQSATVDLCEWVLSGAESPAPLRERPGGPRAPLHRVAARTVLGIAPDRPVGARVRLSASGPRARSLARRRAVADGSGRVLAVPLLAAGQLLGVVELRRTATAEPFGEDDLLLARELADRAALSLDNARRRAREQALALMLQQSLLPGALPRQRSVEFAHRYLPAPAGVGGDWYDVVRLSGARVALAVGDVAGQGLHAAAAMGRLRTAVRNFSALDLPAEELLGQLDALVDALDQETGGTGPSGVLGATCLYAVYDPVSRRCTLASAGHPRPVLLLPDGRAEFLDVPSGPPLGLGGSPFEAVERELPDGAQLVLYTNGLLSGRDQDVDAGLERLRGALAGHADRTPEQTCAAVLAQLLPRRPRDDVALLVARPRPMDACSVAAWDVPLEPAGVSQLRCAVAEQLAAWGLEELSFTTELIVSELVTNAIRYTSGPAQLRLLRDQALICEVADSASTSPRLRRARTTDEGGRGLFLVAQLADRWGTRHTPTGKVIWAEQPLPGGGRRSA